MTDKDHKIIFLAGVAEGEDKVWHFFDQAIVLSIDEATMRSRIENREGNPFGKTPEEMKVVLAWMENYDRIYRGYGAIFVDAAKPLNQVIDEIVHIVNVSLFS